MYQELKLTCTAIVLLIEPFALRRRHCRCRRGFLNLPIPLSELYSNINPKGLVIVPFSNFSGVMWTENIRRVFRVKLLWRTVDGAELSTTGTPRTTSIKKNTFLFYHRISRYSKVICFIYHCQNWRRQRDVPRIITHVDSHCPAIVTRKLNLLTHSASTKLLSSLSFSSFSASIWFCMLIDSPSASWHRKTRKTHTKKHESTWTVLLLD